jgi:activator of HSP90 ATPase
MSVLLCAVRLQVQSRRWAGLTEESAHDVDSSGSRDQASPGPIFEYLTNGDIFSAATGMPARVSDREGDRFSLFGGRVEGRQIELVPRERVVQAWRFGGGHPDVWEPGLYSIVRFTLRAEGDATRFVIDHTGIPPEWEDHIESGYPTFYAGPMTEYFGA